MMRILLGLGLILVAVVATFAQPPAPPVFDDTITAVNDVKYQQQMAEALRRGLRYVVYVNQVAKQEPGALVLELRYPDREPNVVRGYPKDGVMYLEEAKATTPFGEPRQPRIADDKLQDKLVSLWPKDVDMPKGLRAYTPTRKSQRLTITNDVDTNLIYDKAQDDHFSNAPTVVNPNRTNPWNVPGGLDYASGWESIIAVALPSQPTVYDTRVEAGARHPLPKRRWTFPEGTVFVDLLAKDGKPFELRTRTKVNGLWVSRVDFADKAARPANYHGAGRSCIECHEHAGSQLQYGIGLRGDDGVFSWSPWDHLND